MDTFKEDLPVSQTGTETPAPKRPVAGALPPISASAILNRFLGLVVLAGSLALYYLTTCPVIYFGDAGELIVAAWRGGIAHPPGYPLYVILLAIFLRLPLGFLAPHAEFVQRVAWQANFLSAVLGAATVWVVYLILLRILRRPWWAFPGALLAAVGKTFWSQTGIAEVYALNALMAAILTLTVLLMSETQPASDERRRLFRWGSLTWGLSLANHHEMIFFAPVWLAMLKLAAEVGMRKPGTRSNLRSIFRDGVLFLALGLLPYLYLPIASAFNPPLNWGHPSNLVNFIRVITRADYRGIKAGITGDLITSWDILKAFIWSRNSWSFIQYFPAYVLLAIPGLSILFRRSPQRLALNSVGISLLLMSAAFIIYFARIDRSSLFFLEVYFIPWYLGLAGLTAIGCATIFTAGDIHSRSIRPVLVAIASLVVLAFAIGTGFANQKASSMRSNIVGYVYAHDVVETLPAPPQKAMLLTGGDEIFLFWYWQFVEGTDKEMVPIGIDTLGIRRSWFWDDLKRDHPDLVLPDFDELAAQYSGDELRWRTLDALLRANQGVFRAYMTVWDHRLDTLLREAPWHMVMDGPILELERHTNNTIADYPRSSVPEDRYLFKKLLDIDRTGLGPYERDIYNRYAAACYNMAVYFSQSGDPARAAEFAGLCLQFQPDYSPGERMTKPEELLAFNLVKSGDLERAKSILEGLMKTDPQNSLYHVYMAEVLVAEGDNEGARREAGIALGLEPDNPFIIGLYRELFEDSSDQKRGQ